jgi:hypothetical protein
VASKVEEFFRNAPPKDTSTSKAIKLMRTECLKWHPDKLHMWLHGAKLSEVEGIMVEMILRVVTGILNTSADRSSKQWDD